jgi:hypothetical protein
VTTKRDALRRLRRTNSPKQFLAVGLTGRVSRQRRVPQEET